MIDTSYTAHYMRLAWHCCLNLTLFPSRFATSEMCINIIPKGTTLSSPLPPPVQRSQGSALHQRTCA
ncbi:hypothetical protein OBBRIDRAFT_244745 [Obba rivulosa]|uniref:Uncharacterized protein n=1 Tax=Obba rivulosa TaxID=1052685 RepID=A0A8E2DL00_9APHY|nr:hypothetical protein OBBRIDRAFT_244745 [Obba rivulosa]